MCKRHKATIVFATESGRLRSEFGQDNVTCFRRKGLFVRNMHILFIFIILDNHSKAALIA